MTDATSRFGFKSPPSYCKAPRQKYLALMLCKCSAMLDRHCILFTIMYWYMTGLSNDICNMLQICTFPHLKHITNRKLE